MVGEEEATGEVDRKRTAAVNGIASGSGSESGSMEGHGTGVGDGVHAGGGEGLGGLCCRKGVEASHIRSRPVVRVDRVAPGWGGFPGRRWEHR